MRPPETITRSKAVILTGAGASVPLGLPSTAEFLRVFRDQGVRERIPDADSHEDLFGFITDRLHIWDPPDIEHVLARLESNAESADQLASDQFFMRLLVESEWSDLATLALSAKVSTTHEEFRQRLGDSLRSGLLRFVSFNRTLADAIRDEVIDRYGNIDATQAGSLYRGLLGIFRDQFAGEFGCGDTLPFFTLNYDVAVEAAATQLGFRLVDGFADSPTGRTWNPETYLAYQEQTGRLNVVLVKLHGSVKLGRTEDGSLIELPLGLRRNPQPHRHAVLYPALGRKQLRQEPYRTNYTLLRMCLLHATLLIVIGCSLRDDELNDLIRDCMIENTSLHLVVVGPNADHKDIAQRLDCPGDRIGAGVGSFEIESQATIDRGQGRTVNMLRRWMASACSVNGPHLFGTNADF